MKLTNKILKINNRRTSMRLCTKEWNAIDNICLREKIHRNKLITMIEENKDQSLGLAYATRVFALLYYQEAAADHSTNLKRLLKHLV